MLRLDPFFLTHRRVIANRGAGHQRVGQCDALVVWRDQHDMKREELLDLAADIGISMVSPTRTMRKATTMSPAAKLASEPCRERAMASPAAPSNARIEVVSTPSCWSTAIRITISSVVRRELARKEATVGSIRPRSSRRRS